MTSPEPRRTQGEEPQDHEERLRELARRASAAERKAAVEAIAEKEFGPLSKAPWKKSPAAPSSPRLSSPRGTPPPPSLPADPRSDPPKGKKVVLLDTNALLMQFQFHIDLESELRRVLDFAYEIRVPTTVLRELEALCRELGGKEGAEARLALELAKTYPTLEAPEEGDAGILKLAERYPAVVVTNDKVLRARLRAKGIPNIYMRSRAYLTMEGHVEGT